MQSKGGKRITIDVLMEGPGGELLFQPVKASKDELRKLVEASTNHVVRHNIEKSVKEKRRGI